MLNNESFNVLSKDEQIELLHGIMRLQVREMRLEDLKRKMGDIAARLKKCGHKIETNTLMNFMKVFFTEESEKTFSVGKVEAVTKKF